jgi:hypothetical protein
MIDIRRLPSPETILCHQQALRTTIYRGRYLLRGWLGSDGEARVMWELLNLRSQCGARIGNLVFFKVRNAQGLLKNTLAPCERRSFYAFPKVKAFLSKRRYRTANRTHNLRPYRAPPNGPNSTARTF